jgi:hypothetical protein
VKTYRSLFLTAVCAIALSACREVPEQPTLSDATLARIMADLHVAEAATTGLGGYEKDSLTQVYFKQVFEIHGIKKEEYERNIRLIARDELHLAEVADSAIALLKMRREE